MTAECRPAPQDASRTHALGRAFCFGTSEAAAAQAICSSLSPTAGSMPEPLMDANPFSPPQSHVADTAPPLAAATKPVSVWVTQAVGVILACAALYGLVKGLAPDSGF